MAIIQSTKKPAAKKPTTVSEGVASKKKPVSKQTKKAALPEPTDFEQLFLSSIEDAGDGPKVFVLDALDPILREQTERRLSVLDVPVLETNQNISPNLGTVKFITIDSSVAAYFMPQLLVQTYIGSVRSFMDSYGLSVPDFTNTAFHRGELITKKGKLVSPRAVGFISAIKALAADAKQDGPLSDYRVSRALPEVPRSISQDLFRPVEYKRNVATPLRSGVLQPILGYVPAATAPTRADTEAGYREYLKSIKHRLHVLASWLDSQIIANWLSQPKNQDAFYELFVSTMSVVVYGSGNNLIVKYRSSRIEVSLDYEATVVSADDVNQLGEVLLQSSSGKDTDNDRIGRCLDAVRQFFLAKSVGALQPRVQSFNKLCNDVNDVFTGRILKEFKNHGSIDKPSNKFLVLQGAHVIDVDNLVHKVVALRGIDLSKASISSRLRKQFPNQYAERAIVLETGMSWFRVVILTGSVSFASAVRMENLVSASIPQFADMTPVSSEDEILLDFLTVHARRSQDLVLGALRRCSELETSLYQANLELRQAQDLVASQGNMGREEIKSVFRRCKSLGFKMSYEKSCVRVDFGIVVAEVLGHGSKPLGNYSVLIQPRHDGIEMLLVVMAAHSRTRIHPHGWSDEVCLGDFELKIRRALLAFDLATAVQYAYEFLAHTNIRDSRALSYFNNLPDYVTATETPESYATKHFEVYSTEGIVSLVHIKTNSTSTSGNDDDEEEEEEEDN